MDDGCQYLRSLLAGEVEYIIDLEEGGRQHWHGCPECQEAVPDAIAQLDNVEQQLLRDTASNIERIYHQYQSDVSLAEVERIEEWQQRLKHTSSLPLLLKLQRPGETPPPSPDKLYRLKVLSCLAKAGAAVSGELQVLNDNWGLDWFRPSDPDCEYGSRTCPRMFAMLPQNVPVFIFQSALASDLIQLFEGGFRTDDAGTIHNLVRNAAPELLKSFLAAEAAPVPAGSVSTEISQPTGNNWEHIEQKLDEYCQRTEQDLDNAVDSLKACQMEMMRFLAPVVERTIQREQKHLSQEEMTTPPTASEEPGLAPREEPSADLATIRHLLIRILDFLEGPGPKDAEHNNQSVGGRLNRLRDAEKIPRIVATLMRAILDFRNAVEYDQYKLSAEESATVMATWRTIVSWAKKQGWSET